MDVMQMCIDVDDVILCVQLSGASAVHVARTDAQGCSPI